MIDEQKTDRIDQSTPENTQDSQVRNKNDQPSGGALDEAYKVCEINTLRAQKKMENAMIITGAILLLNAIFMFLYPLILAIFSESGKDVAIFSGIYERIVFDLGIISPIIIVLMYWFRVCYADYRSVKGVEVQLFNKLSMYRFFLDAYNLDKINLTNKEQAERMKKFESLMFSQISMDPQKIPGTFDGFDQITSLVKAFKSKD